MAGSLRSLLPNASGAARTVYCRGWLDCRVAHDPDEDCARHSWSFHSIRMAGLGNLGSAWSGIGLATKSGPKFSVKLSLRFELRLRLRRHDGRHVRLHQGARDVESRGAFTRQLQI